MGRKTIRTARRFNAEFVIDLQQRRRWYDEGGDTDASGTDDAQSTQQPSRTQTQGEATISLSQQALNDRLARAKRSALKELLAELGVESTDALKAKVQPSQQENPLLTKVSALEQQLAQLAAESEAAKQRAAELEAQRRQDATLDALKQAVKALRVKDTVADDILGWALMNKRDLSKLLADDLKPNAEEMKTLIDEARAARPDWFKPLAGSIPSNFEGTPSEPDKKARELAARVQAAKLRAQF